MNQPMLKVEKLSYSYETAKILDQVSFSLEKGEIGSLIGASGSGKTTLFRLLTGLIQPDEGHISINNHLKPEAHHDVACMMQEDLLLPWRTILKNLTLLTELGKKPTINEELEQDAYQLLDGMGLKLYAEHFPHQLSGGMRQRVSLARALLQKRPLLLLDEPFGSLDVSLREQMYVLLRKLQEKNETTMLLITHDFRDALMLSDRIFMLGEGKICEEWYVTKEIREDPLASSLLLDQMRQKIIEFSRAESIL